MPLEGLIDCFGNTVPWSKLAETYTRGHWVIPTDIAPGGGSWPLAFLLALGSGREQPDGIRVSSLLESPLRAGLKRSQPFWSKPHELLYMVDGTAVHWWLAQAGPSGAEERVHMQIGTFDLASPVVVSGQPDSFNAKTGTLSDYKRMTSFGLKKLLENGLEAERPEYVWQLRFYAVLLAENGHKVVPPYQLLVWASDWRKPMRGQPRDPRFGVFEVMPGENDRAELVTRVEALMSLEARALRLDDACEDREKFGVVSYGGLGVPRRCAEYCSVNRYCPWWQMATK